MARRSEGSLRILLILSAIDLLSSAVTAGLVLFVVLVGGDAGASKGESASPGAAGLNQIEIVHASGQPALFKQGMPSLSPEAPDPYETAFFSGPAKLVHRFYLVPSSLKRLVVTSINSGVELIVRPVSGDSVKLFVRCSNAQDYFELPLQPLTLQDCQAVDGATAVQIAAGSTLLLPLDKTVAGLPKEQARTGGFAKFKLSVGITLPSSQAIWGIAE
jgi:hypothetical protein